MKSFRKLCIVLAVCSSSMLLPMKQQSYEFNKSAVIAHGLGKISVKHDAEGFKILHEGQSRLVKNQDIEKSLRTMSPENFASFVKAGGCVTVNKFDNGDFKLGTTARLKGGFDWFGAAIWLIQAYFGGAGGTAGVGPSRGVSGGVTKKIVEKVSKK